MAEHFFVAVLLSAAGYHYDDGHGAFLLFVETCGVGQRAAKGGVVVAVGECNFLGCVGVGRLWCLRAVLFNGSGFHVERKRESVLRELAFQHAVCQPAFVHDCELLDCDFNSCPVGYGDFGGYAFGSLVGTVEGASYFAVAAFCYIEYKV